MNYRTKTKKTGLTCLQHYTYVALGNPAVLC